MELFEMPSWASFILAAFQQGDDRHRMAVAKVEIILEPSDDVAGLDAGAQVSVFHEAFLRRERAEIGRALARPGLDVVEIGLE
jgi:hypothetical protein